MGIFTIIFYFFHLLLGHLCHEAYYTNYKLSLLHKLQLLKQNVHGNIYTCIGLDNWVPKIEILKATGHSNSHMT